MKTTDRTIALLTLGILLVPCLAVAKDQDHFLPGEIRTSLSWDNISAMESGILRFGGSAGITLLRGLEIGYEQQFIVPKAGYECRSWGYVRLVPFRELVVNPFLAARAGYYFLPEKDAVAFGGGGGAVIFIDKHFAFEASIYVQAVIHPTAAVERQTEFEWRVIAYF